VIRLEPRCASIQVRGLHVCVSNIPLGPEYVAHVRMFDRRLWWDIVYLDADMDASLARKIADEIFETLLAAAGAE
jgi:hypothetical protein